MAHIQYYKPLLLLLLVQLSFTSLIASQRQRQRAVKSAVFLSPPLTLRPGSVASKLYYNVPFPRGHIALKSFNGEVVDETGTPVPLHETYLHHWVMERYYARKGSPTETNYSDIKSSGNSSYIWARNAGICTGILTQHFGLGSETRRTDTWVPDPYGIEVGNPSQIPDGYEERWMLNVHAIDTRGVVDRLGCTECKCSLYNATKDEFGAPLPEDYVGGMYCCYDQSQCKVREDYGSVVRTLHIRYTVKWLDWPENHLVVPVKIYIFDVTDSGEPVDPTEEDPFKLSCKVEYEVEACRVDDNTKCVDSKKVKLVMPTGGDIVYGVAHQHAAGVGAALYGQDGRVLCTSNPKYGEGEDAGDEVGYIIGMSTCYPEPGSVRVADGEVLTLESNYSSSQAHTGVMGLFYILVAEAAPGEMELPKHTLSFVLAGGVLMAAAGICYLWKKRKDAAYETLAMA